MSRLQDREKSFDASRLVIAAIDGEFVKEGLENGTSEEITRLQLEESRIMMERYDELLQQGYTEEQIDTLWEGKTHQEILALTSAKNPLTRQ